MRKKTFKILSINHGYLISFFGKKIIIKVLINFAFASF